MGIIQKGRKLGSQLKKYGPKETVRRGTKKLAANASRSWDWDELDFPLREEDIATPASAGQRLGTVEEGKPLKIGWVCSPPSSGSGGHTTLFRMVATMEARGHECTLFLYDRFSDDVSHHEATIRNSWPSIHPRIASATSMTGQDAVIASAWASAHVVAKRSVGDARRFYFIQDYEPYFYPAGYLSTLAEMTYSFGFDNIALGEMVAWEMSRNGVDPEIIVPFGCDRDTYKLLPKKSGAPARHGVVYYAKQSVDRRGYALAKAALERFHELCPNQPIHVIGDNVSGWRAPITSHGSMRPADLNSLYNEVIAGLAMSFTNVSLVPGELLASGVVPVLNEAENTRRDFEAEPAVWADPTPEALARALARTVSVNQETIAKRAAEAAAAAPQGWETTQAMVAGFIESRCRTRVPEQSTR